MGGRGGEREHAKEMGLHLGSPCLQIDTSFFSYPITFKFNNQGDGVLVPLFLFLKFVIFVRSEAGIPCLM